MIIVRYGELWTKSEFVRKRMIDKLTENIRDCYKRNGKKLDRIVKKRGRILIYGEECPKLKNVFGIVSYSVAEEVDNIKEAALRKYTGGTFRITTKRINKNYPKTSQEVNREVGEYIVKHTGAKVDLEHPDVNIGIEIMDKAYIFNNEVKCYGGLPVGVTGHAYGLCEDEKGANACILMMRRGLRLSVYGECANVLKEYDYGNPIKIVSREEVLNARYKVVPWDFNKVNDIKPGVLAPLLGYLNLPFSIKCKS